jgi:hypothetical protein
MTRVILLVTALSSLVLGCHRDRDAEGPMERAGKHVDNAAQKTGKALGKAAEKTGQAAEKAAHKTGEALEKTGQKLKGNDSAGASPEKD